MIGDASRPAIDPAHARLEAAGFMCMMVVGEPRLSEIVGKFKQRGYEVEVVPYVPEETGGEPLTPAESASAGGTIYVRKDA
jgi:hypothetical protein